MSVATAPLLSPDVLETRRRTDGLLQEAGSLVDQLKKTQGELREVLSSLSRELGFLDERIEEAEALTEEEERRLDGGLPGTGPPEGV